jgi:ABC-type Mn2+/Zn2+ transport system permease subunit
MRNHDCRPSAIQLTKVPQTGLCIVWLNSNFAGHFKRATALGVVFSVGNSSGIVVGQIFTAPSAPRYLNGSRITVGFSAFAMMLIVEHVVALRYVNKKREQRLAARTELAEERGKVGYSDYDDAFRYNL